MYGCFLKNQLQTQGMCNLLRKKLKKEESTIKRNENTSHLWRHLDDHHENDMVSYSD
jgi:hypothetical protein